MSWHLSMLDACPNLGCALGERACVGLAYASGCSTNPNAFDAACPASRGNNVPSAETLEVHVLKIEFLIWSGHVSAGQIGSSRIWARRKLGSRLVA